jgi:hypothetical protein
MLDDGTYDVLVVDAAEGSGPGVVGLELTVLDGTHKGEVVKVTASGIERDPLDLLGIPGTLVVVDGEPRVHLEG